MKKWLKRIVFGLLILLVVVLGFLHIAMGLFRFSDDKAFKLFEKSGFEGQVHMFQRGVHKGNLPRRVGIVDQHIELAEPRYRRFNNTLAVFLDGNVRGHKADPIAQLVLERSAIVFVDINDQYAGAFFDKGADDTTTDTAGTAGDNRDFVLQSQSGTHGL